MDYTQLACLQNVSLFLFSKVDFWRRPVHFVFWDISAAVEILIIGLYFSPLGFPILLKQLGHMKEITVDKQPSTTGTWGHLRFHEMHTRWIQETTLKSG